MKRPVQLPSTSLTILSAFRDYLTNLGLSSISRKLYLSDITRLLNSALLKNTSLDLLLNPKTYLSYLSLPEITSSEPLLRRTLSSIRQFGAFLGTTYSVQNPALHLSLQNNSDNSPLPATVDKYIKLFIEYLKKDQLSDLTLKAYKSDVTLYLKTLTSHYPSTHIDILLKENNPTKYADVISLSTDNSPSTIVRKTKSIRRFINWYHNNRSHISLSDNYKSSINFSHTPSSSVSQPISSPNSYSDPKTTPDQTPIRVKNNNSRKTPLFSWFSFRSFVTSSIFIVLLSTLAVFLYQQFAKETTLTAAYPSSPVTPNRQLSFQGRLENASGTPITTSTNLVFKLFDASSGGVELYSTGTCSITPDADGVFSTQIGSTCGSGITSSVFTENANVWLEVTVGAETLTPRQQIATVAYALNSETIQGYPISATVSAVRNTVVPMNQWGEIIVGEQSPRLTGVAGTFQISAPSLTLTTKTGSNGNISLAPDGTGQINLTGNTTTSNFVNISNAQLTTGSLITGTVGNNNSGFKLLDLLSGSSPTSKFSVDSSGNLTLAGTITLPNSNVITGVTNYAQFAQGLSVGGGTTYYINSSGTANLNGQTLSGTLDANGQLDLGDGGDTITLSGSSITLSGFNCAANTNGGTLTTNGSGVLQCSDDDSGAGGSSRWQENLGTISPINGTWDVLVGGTATSSAKIGLININSGTPTINLSNQASNISIKDATSNALQIVEGSNPYLALTTSNGSESLSLGNTTTNPNYNFLGTGTSTFSGPITGTTTTLTPGSNTSALTLTGTNVTSANLAYLNMRNTSGTVLNQSYGSSATLTGTLTGYNLDLSTNVTNALRSVTGMSLTLPTTSGASTTTLKGYTLTGGTVTNSSGTSTWTGLDITTPTIIQSAGTLTSYGLKLELAKILSGTSYGGYINGNGNTSLSLWDGASSNIFAANSGGNLTAKATAFDSVFSCSGSANCSGAATDGGSFTDNTTEAKTSNGTAFTMLATGTAANTSFYVGADHPFNTVYLDIATADVGTTALTLQYWNGSAWTAVSGQNDYTNLGGTPLSQRGAISFSTPTAWTTKSVNGSVALYFVRVVGTTDASTAPTLYAASPTSSYKTSDFAQNNNPVPNFELDSHGYLTAPTLTRPLAFNRVFACTASANCTASGADGGSYTEHTLEAQTNQGTAFNLLSTGTAANTSIYVGSDRPFNTINVDIATADVGSTALNVQYWNGSAWTTVTNQADTTTNAGVPLSQDGLITFTPSSSWTTKSLNSSPSLYWIRIYGTTNATTAPTAYYLSPTTNTRLSVYGQAGDSVAALTINDLGDLTLGTDNDLYPTLGPGSANIGSLSLPWDNIYGVALYQNGNLVCDVSGTNCPAGSLLWRSSLGAISPITDSYDLLLGGVATSSAKIGFINIDSGTPTIALANQASNITIKDATANALQILEGSNAYLALTTSNGTENLSFGNTTTNPSYSFLGSGTSTFSGGVTINGNMLFGDGADTITFNTGAWTISNAVAIDLANSQTSALNFESGLLNLDTAGSKIGIGTTSPTAKLHVTGAVTGKALSIFDETGDQNILSASASGVTKAYITRDGAVVANSFGDYADPASFYLNANDTATSLRIAGDILNTDSATFSISSSSNSNITINAGSGTVEIGSGGAGKLDAGTIDPPYTINGKKFATYMASMTGVKEETTGSVEATEYIPGLGYRATLDFASSDEGSDLWLFSKTTDLKNNIDNLVVLLSSGSNSRTWYTLDATSGQLYLYSTTPTRLSYRLTAPRFDADLWGNIRTSTSEGHVINDTSDWDTSVVIDHALDASDINSATISLEKNFASGQWELKSNSVAIIDELSALKNAVIANLSVGRAQTNELAVDLISPLATDSAVTINGNVVIKDESPTPTSSEPLLLVEGNLEAATISARVAELSQLVTTDATVSGTLYADSIVSKQLDTLESTIASISANTELDTLTSRIRDRLSSLFDTEATALDLPIPVEATAAALPPASLDPNNLVATISADIDFATINQYLAVIGHATINTLSITTDLYTENISSYSNNLAILPSGGILNLADSTLIVDSSGDVLLNGNLTVTGTLTADHGILNQLSLGKVSTATPSSELGNLLAIYDESGTAVATIDASGSANLAGLTTQLITIASSSVASNSSELLGTTTSNSTAGSSVLIAPNIEQTIYSPFVTPDTLVYLTPTTNTDNKVLFVKAKNTCDTNSPSDCQSSFTVAIDAPASSDISFNWWIIQLVNPIADLPSSSSSL